jgi:hypothetical protein
LSVDSRANGANATIMCSNTLSELSRFMPARSWRIASVSTSGARGGVSLTAARARLRAVATAAARGGDVEAAELLANVFSGRKE